VDRILATRRPGLGPVMLALAAVLALGSVIVPSAALATGNSLRVAAAATSASIGDTFTVQVIGNSAGKLSGTAASVTFDKTQLQVTAIVKGANWVAAGSAWAGFPLTANMATFIANANTAGKIPTIAAFFLGADSLAPGDHTLISVTFHAIANGSSSIDLPIGPLDGSMIDGAVATYGDALTVASTGGAVKVGPRPTSAIKALPAWIAATSIPVAWSGTPNGSPIATYDVQVRKAAWNGTFGTRIAWLTATATTTGTYAGVAGYTYCFSVRAKDTNAMSSSWTAETCIATPLDDRSLTRTGKWTLATGATYYKGTVLRATTLGASLTRSGFKARRIAILATTCPTCGSVKVYLGKTLLKTISLKSTATVNRKLITVATFTSTRTGSLVIKVSTSAKKVIIDGVVIRAS